MMTFSHSVFGRILYFVSCCLLFAFSSCVKDNPADAEFGPNPKIFSGFRGKDTLSMTFFGNIYANNANPPFYATPKFDAKIFDSIQVNLSYQNINPMLLIHGSVESYQGEMFVWARI